MCAFCNAGTDTCNFIIYVAQFASKKHPKAGQISSNITFLKILVTTCDHSFRNQYFGGPKKSHQQSAIPQDYDYDWVSEDEDLAADWEVSSAADTASTAASTVEAVPFGAKGAAKAWELALEQAAAVAKRLRGWGMGMWLEVWGDPANGLNSFVGVLYLYPHHHYFFGSLQKPILSLISTFHGTAQVPSCKGRKRQVRARTAPCGQEHGSGGPVICGFPPVFHGKLQEVESER